MCHRIKFYSVCSVCERVFVATEERFQKKVNTRFSSVQVVGKNREIPHCFLLSRGNKSRYRRFLGIFIYHSADILKKISGVTCSLRAEKVLYIVYRRRFSSNVGKIFTFDLLRPGNASCNKK